MKVTEVDCPKQTIFEPRDTGIKLGKKGKIKWIGSKCHIVETAIKGEINLITGMIQQEAHASDHKIHEKLNKENNKIGLKPEKVFADGNYISSESIRNYRENNQELMGYVGSNTSKKDERFKLEKFAIDFDKKEAVCPMNKKSRKYTIAKSGDYNIYFDKNDCMICENFNDCAEAKSKNARRLHLNKYYDLLRERRKEQKEKDFKDEMKVRAQVEATISELVRFHGLRKAKYKNEEGRQMQFYLSASALNTKRLIKILTYGKKIA